MAQEMGPTVGMLEFKGTACGYLALDQILKKFAEVKLVESASKLNGEFWILLELPHDEFLEELQKFVSELRGIEEFVFWAKEDLDIFPAMFGLSKVKVKKYLYVLETIGMCSNLMAISEICANPKFELVDFQSSKFADGTAIAYVTSDEKEDFSETLEMVEAMDFAVIEEPHKVFREYFDIDGAE